MTTPESPNREAIPDDLSRIAAVIEEDGGAWRPCSGCQESSEGVVSTKDYPYSEAFQCQPGAGCRECGGIGVLWESGDFYDGLAEFYEDDERTRENVIAALAGLWIHDGKIEGQQSVADAILALKSGEETIPAGYVVVPREPTEAMMEAGQDAFADEYGTAPLDPADDREAAGRIWSAMLAAIPTNRGAK